MNKKEHKEHTLIGEVTGLRVQLLKRFTPYGQKYLVTLWVGDKLFSFPSFSPKPGLRLNGEHAPLARGDMVKVVYLVLGVDYHALIYAKSEIIFNEGDSHE